MIVDSKCRGVITVMGNEIQTVQESKCGQQKVGDMKDGKKDKIKSLKVLA